MTLSARLRAALRDGHDQNHWTERLDIGDPRIGDGLVLAPAAVLVAVTDRSSPGIILTQRSAKLRKHPGQIAFPGGRIDESDADEVAAALREAEEEIALSPSAVEVIGTSDRYHSITGFDIVPVLGIVPPDLQLTPRAGEVENLFEVPLDFVLDPANRVRHAIEYEGGIRHYYEIMWQDRRIWGVTAAILANLSKRLGYESPSA